MCNVIDLEAEDISENIMKAYILGNIVHQIMQRALPIKELKVWMKQLLKLLVNMSQHIKEVSEEAKVRPKQDHVNRPVFVLAFHCVQGNLSCVLVTAVMRMEYREQEKKSRAQLMWESNWKLRGRGRKLGSVNLHEPLS